MNFSNIKSIEIPLGVVKQITTSLGVVLWKAEEEPVGPIPEWYGKSENYDFSLDYFNMLPLDNGTVYFELINGNENYLLYNNTGSDNDTWSTLPLTLVETLTNSKRWSMSVTKLLPIYLKITSADYKFYTSLFSNVDPRDPNRIYNMTSDFYARGNLDKSFYTVNASQNMVFKSLFESNTHLIGAKYLVFLTLDTGMTYEGYASCWMFKNCSNLITTPICEISIRSRGTFQEAFEGCTNITNSLRYTGDTTIDIFQCPGMYRNCSSLNYIFMLATGITDKRNGLAGWVQGVAATGIFVKNIDATWTDTGDSGVPTGWTVIYYDTTELKYYLDQLKSQECDDHGNPLANYSQQPFTIVAKESGTITMYGGTYEHYDSVEDTTEMAWYEFEQSTDEGLTWTAVPYEPDDGNSYITLTVSADDRIMLRCNAAALADDTDNSGLDYSTILYFGDSNTLQYEVEGNIMSLIYGSNFIGKTESSYTSLITGLTSNFMFSTMFNSNVGLLSAENLILPSTVLFDGIYIEMFGGCTSLTTAPVLPATTLADNCYSSMFNGCSSLTTAPELPVTTLATNCYSNMFNSCSSLTTAPALPATTLADFCYAFMFKNCTSLNHITMLATDISASNCLWNWVDGVAATGTFVKAASMTSLPTGSSGIPSGWTVTDAS